jgi:DNA-binding MarR family transcriptional regulator
MELSSVLKVDKTTTTKAVKKLIDASYVYKELDKQDKRGYNIMPTNKALKIYDLIIEEENRNIEVCFKGFSEEEKEIAIALIEKMSKNIEEDWVKIKNRGGK